MNYTPFVAFLRFLFFAISTFWMMEFINDCDDLETTTGNIIFVTLVVLVVLAHIVYTRHRQLNTT